MQPKIMEICSSVRNFKPTPCDNDYFSLLISIAMPVVSNVMGCIGRKSKFCMHGRLLMMESEEEVNVLFSNAVQ